MSPSQLSNIINAINELIHEPYTTKETKKNIFDSLSIIKDYSYLYEQNIIDLFIEATKYDYIKKNERNALKQNKKAIINIIKKHYDSYINSFNSGNESESSISDNDSENSISDNNSESNVSDNESENNVSNDESSSQDSICMENMSTKEIASILVGLRKQGRLKITNEKISLCDEGQNNENCTIC